jgi:hypothetical protein
MICMKERCHSQTGNNNSEYVTSCDNYYSPSYTQPYIYNNGGHYKTCRCCCGTGVQTRCDGIRICCPACNGSGRIWVPCRMHHPFHPCPPPWYKPIIWCSTSNNSEI